jgi:hypothetical protein
MTTTLRQAFAHIAYGFTCGTILWMALRLYGVI